MIMEDVLFFMELQVHFYIIQSHLKYELFAVRSLSRSLRLGVTYREFHYSQYGINERGKRKPSKHCNRCLLLFNRSLVFWNRVLLHV